MNYESTIEKLLEEILDSSRTPEEICAACPEMLDEVRTRLRKIRSVEAQVDLLFPTSVRTARCDSALSPPRERALPVVPGYEVQSVLGQGGMGVVYHARHLKLNRSVALKMTLAGAYASPSELLRFLREAEAVAGLRHPHIVQVYDVGEVDGRPYYTMEYVDGGNLAEKLSSAPLSVRESAETISVLAMAVHSAHEGGIVHRDLKPANILLTADAMPKISDFGLARRVDVEGGLTVTGTKIGTPSYMAPEQVAGTSIGPAVDIYALGALLYEMLTGQPPFRGDSIGETERRLMSEEPVPPSRWNANVPRDLETICLKCLQKVPQQRYASAADFADDLKRFLRYEPIRARPVTNIERLVRWARRNPTTAALFAMALALGAMLVVEGTQERALAAGRRAEKTRLTARLESGLELERQGKYSEARAILGQLGDGGHDDLRRRIDGALVSLNLMEELDAVCLNRVSVVLGPFDVTVNKVDADTKYAALFERMGVGTMRDAPQAVADRIQESDVRIALVAALDDWAECTSEPDKRNWLLEVARLADPDPSGWRDRVRDPATWNDRRTLSNLAKSISEATASVQLLRVLGDRLDDAGLDSIAFRKQVQQQHPNDFLANASLANALRERDPIESMRYYQAALAVRPHASPAYNNLAVVLAKLGRTKEAIALYQEALRVDPHFVLAHYNLGMVFLAGGQSDEAVESFQRAIQMEFNDAIAYGALGEALFHAQRTDEAEAALQQCLTLLPEHDPRRHPVETLLQQCRDSKSG